MYRGIIIDQVLSTENLNQAYKKVKSNKGAAGGDGMKVKELGLHLVKHKEVIIKQIRTRTYQPQPVKRVSIQKPNGGTRALGIPTVTDRVIQQSIAQVLTPIFDRDFHDNSYGLRGTSYYEIVGTDEFWLFLGG